MNLDPSAFPRSISPASSDSSLTRSRLRGKEDDLKKNKNYRRYASSVERALSLFDTALQEWADYISFLSRLLKALQTHPPDLPVVPHKVLVSKRLAQCLNPSLPSGVHQKALEVYAYIFGLIKPEGLSQDLPLYFPGIAPTLTFASLTARPLFLSLVETFICPLEPWAIRPALKAIILALLPGLEEETSDDFDPTLRLINKFRDAAGQIDTQKAGTEGGATGQYFWQCLFLASITSPSRRSGVLAYLNRHLPKLGVTGRRPSAAEAGDSLDLSPDMLAAAESVIQPEPGLLIRCFASGLFDEQVLVQRNFLDLLVTHLPLSSPILQSRITKDDLQRLIIAAVGVVLRRDMSLNRRLWAWLLGPESANDRLSYEARNSISDNPNQVTPDSAEISQPQYFSHFGLQPLVKGLLEMIEQDTCVPSERSKPFRISLSLMDRWEVGGLIVSTVFLPIMRNVQAFETVASKGQFDEVFRSASAFFDGVESGVIFSELLELVDWKTDDLIQGKALNNLTLAAFILENFNVREEDMILVHAPLLTLALLIKMSELSTMPEKDTVSFDQRQNTSNGMTRVINALVGLLTERAFSSKSALGKKATNDHTPGMGHADILSQIHKFYDQSKSSLDLPPLPFIPKHIGELVIREAHELAISALESLENTFPIQERVNLLIALLKKVPKSRILRDRRFYLAISNRMHIGQGENIPVSFSIVSSITSSVTSLYFIHAPGFHVSYEDVSDLIPAFVKQIWQFLSPSSPKFHVEAVRCLWHLHSVSWLDHLVEASITSLMVDTSLPGPYHVSSEEQAERYFVLWNHSHHGTYELPPKQVNDIGESSFTYHSSMLERPLFIVLDLLSRGANEASQAVQIWLQDLPSIHKVFRILMSRLDALFLRAAHSATEGQNLAVSADDYKECTYLFSTISEVISALSHNGWIALLSQAIVDRGHDASSSSEENPESKNVHSNIFHVTVKVVGGQRPSLSQVSPEEVQLQQTSLSVMRQLLLGPGAEELADSGVDTFLVEQLDLMLEGGGHVLVQGAIIDALLAALKVRFAQAYLPPPRPRPKHQRANSRDQLTSPSLLSFTSDKADKGHSAPSLPQPPQQLLECLLKGMSSPNSRDILEKWILLLCEVLVPLYSNSLFPVVMKLVECFCKEIERSYENLQLAFKQRETWPEDRSEHVTIALLTGLETCIASAHERLHLDETHTPAAKSPDPSQGFFGNMVSGVFTSDSNQTRPTAANNRLTVLLCFQDAVRLCFSIWSWGATERSGLPNDTESMASFQYTSLRMRNRSRRILEHLFTAEVLECLETLVDMWTKSNADNSSLIFDLLHTLDGSRPKIAIPAIFNAIYTRTNPHALDPTRKSAMTSNISESELAAFLVTYARSLDDDVLDEIWGDCTTFLRDVLSNPFPHRQILPRLVEFAAILGTKLENTNFGDSRRMRKELGDVLLRLLTAIFTSKPLGLSDSGHARSSSFDHEGTSSTNVGPDDMLSILAVSMPAFTTTLGDSDRISSAVAGISINVIGPILRSRLFPNNVNRNVLILLQHIAKVPAAAKTWKKDIADAFNDPRFFSSQIGLVKDGWMNLLRQWVLADKDRLTELLGRLPPPSTAGIMFGVGASAARLDADRKAQLNLRRIALLILSANGDYFAGELPGLLQKLEDLLGATSSSSPSSATRAEVYMVLRALALKTSTTTLVPFWPLINTELQEALSAVPMGHDQELYSPYSMLQACKLLDTLLVLAPDDFQLVEWLFVTDTIDAVYPPNHWEPLAIADEVSQSLGLQSAITPTSPVDPTEPNNRGTKQPWLTSDWIRETAKDEIVERVLRPFFDRLSIHAFESTYTMGSPDLEICRDDLLTDLLNESTMAN